MLGLRKKPDGFEWHKYIRTTIKLRREHRRQRVLDARRAAGQQMHAAGAALAAGSKAAGAAARSGVVAGAIAAGLAAQALLAMMWHFLRVLMRPIIDAVARPNVGGPLALAGGIALGAAFGRYRSIGLDGETLVTLVIGLVLMSVLLPMLSRSTGWRMPSMPPSVARLGAIGLAVALIAAGLTWVVSAGKFSVSNLGQLPLIGGGEPVVGRASVLGADTLRVANKVVRLVGIEAPEARQRCGRSGRQWNCGAAAETALERLVGGRTVRCTPSGSEVGGRVLAYCAMGDLDIGAELVRRGHVFAQSGLFARYAGEERTARDAKAGLWSGETERPADYRAKVWEEAKRRAPDGCPIKGLVTGEGRIYVLPWSPNYERGRIQRARGERWFCSEQEAVGAGFRAAERG